MKYYLSIAACDCLKLRLIIITDPIHSINRHHRFTIGKCFRQQYRNNIPWKILRSIFRIFKNQRYVK